MNIDLKAYLENVPQLPGVYQFLGPHRRPLYIGKAKNLKARLSSYLTPDSQRIQHLVEHAQEIILTLTGTEEEALRMEFALIQLHQPPYNILLKDHKSPPYLILTKHEYPQLRIARKPQSALAQHGPYPQSDLAQQQLERLTKIFKLRTCSDSFFSMRKRPCLQYQIGRCSAPCMKDSDGNQDYQDRVQSVISFFEGHLDEHIHRLTFMMQQYAEKELFEEATTIRNEIQQLRYVERQNQKELSKRRYDILALKSDLKILHHMICMDGQIIYSQSLKFQNPLDNQGNDLFEAIIRQLYQQMGPEWAPPELIMRTGDSFKTLIHEKNILCHHPNTAEEEEWLSLAEKSLLYNSLTISGKTTTDYEKQFEEFESFFLQKNWAAIECIDISHHRGDQTSAGIVRCGRYGFEHEYYRKYQLPPSENDLASMRYALEKHFRNAEAQGLKAPDCFLIDGGELQLQIAQEVRQSFLGWLEHTLFIAIAKGVERKNGKERYWILTDHQIEELHLSTHPQLLLLAQEIRDESHRYVGLYRTKRKSKESLKNLLEDLPGLGESKKKELLRVFGGWRGLQQATVEQLRRVPGIGKARAEAILKFLDRSPHS